MPLSANAGQYLELSAIVVKKGFGPDVPLPADQCSVAVSGPVVQVGPLPSWAASGTELLFQFTDAGDAVVTIGDLADPTVPAWVVETTVANPVLGVTGTAAVVDAPVASP